MSSKGCGIEIANEWEDRHPSGMVARSHKGDTNLVGEDDAGMAAPNKHAAESAWEHTQMLDLP